MSKYVDIEPIIESVYAKWGGDPAYYVNDTPTGCEARRDAELIEMLRGKPSVDIVRCKDCKWSEPYRTESGNVYFACIEAGVSALSDNDYCSYGERRKANE